MKFRLIGLLFIALFGTAGIAQEEDTTSYSKFGIQVSMNASRVTAVNFYGLNKVGLNAGIYYDRLINEQLHWEIGAAYSQKGALKPPNHKAGDYTKYLLSLDYVELQGLLRLTPKDIQYDIGLAGGYLLSQREDNETGAILGTPNVNKFDLSLVAGFHFPLSEKLSVGLRLQHSILPIRSVNAASPTSIFNRGQFNQHLTFMLRYNIAY